MKATPDSWSHLEHWAVQDGSAACILELRARVEALEAAANSPAGLTSSAPAGSLVERVMGVLGHHGPGTARAAIREVAEWLREEGYPSSPGRLEREVEQ